MTLEAVSNVADIIGVILVVASLIYVARQLHQNTEMLRSNSRQAALNADLDGLTSLIEHPVDFLTLDSSALSPEQELRVQFILVKTLRAREFSWFQYRSGVLDEATWQSYLAPSRAVFSSDKARRLLETYTGDPEFKAYFLEWLNNSAGAHAT